MNWYKKASGSGMPSMTLRDVAKFLRGQGFEPIRSKRHAIFQAPGGKTIALPNHNAKDVSKRIVMDMLKQIGWTNQQFKDYHSSKGKVVPEIDYSTLDKVRHPKGFDAVA